MPFMTVNCSCVASSCHQRWADTHRQEVGELLVQQRLQLLLVQLVLVSFFSRVGVKHIDEARHGVLQFAAHFGFSSAKKKVREVESGFTVKNTENVETKSCCSSEAKEMTFSRRKPEEKQQKTTLTAAAFSSQRCYFSLLRGRVMI